MRLLTFGTAVALSVLAAGCFGESATDSAQRSRTDRQQSLESVRIGMSEAEVRDRLGPPRKVLADRNGPEPDRPGQADPCWLYPMRDGTWRYICFGPDRRVADIADSVARDTRA